MSSLTDSQVNDLHCSIYRYVQWVSQNNGSSDLLNKLQSVLDIDELQLSLDDGDQMLLPKKWGSIIRLQRAITKLEQKCDALQQELDHKTKQLETIVPKDTQIATTTDVNWLPPDHIYASIQNESPVTAIKLHPSLAIVYVGTDTGRLIAYDILNYTIPLAVTTAHSKAITSIEVIEAHNFEEFVDSTTLVSTTSKDAQINVYDHSSNTGELKLIRSFNAHDSTVSSQKTWQKDNDVLLASSSRDTTVKVWRVNDSRCLQSFSPHSEWVKSIDVLDEYILSGSLDSTLRLTHWPSGNGLSVGTGHEFPIERVLIIPFSDSKICTSPYRDQNEHSAFAPLRFKYCASAARDNTIKIWEVPLPQLKPNSAPVPSTTNTTFKCVMTLRGHTSWVKDLKLRGDHLFSCSDDETIKCWDLNTGNCVKTWSSIHNNFINCIDIDREATIEQFSPSLQREILVSGDMDNKVKIIR
ncbi:hypothetical protein B1J92_C02937g [Nakaseomyces glabratus]|nr:hypothetical protein B1J91_C02937g [Nakaseomyces glabratus]OXB50235.1 hypothetical protein B1J92_C02937g [Nakaseomyces glabratus]